MFPLSIALMITTFIFLGLSNKAAETRKNNSYKKTKGFSIAVMFFFSTAIIFGLLAFYRESSFSEEIPLSLLLLVLWIMAMILMYFRLRNLKQRIERERNMMLPSLG
ncbi:MAG: hypothetical protein AAB631_02025 [Patescibacteria group bacterium]